MENQTKIIIIRHGQSIGNANGIILGHTDLDLSEHGYKQANATAEHLKTEKIDKIYSSDLKRAVNTALPNAKMRNLEVICSKNLREMYVGEWENAKTEDIVAKWGREVYEDQWFGGFGTFRFPGGESTVEGGIRFYNEVKKIAAENVGKTILIAAHAAVIRAFWAKISHILPENIVKELPFPTNASYSVALYDGNEIIPQEYSIDHHLTELGITRVKMH